MPTVRQMKKLETIARLAAEVLEDVRRSQSALAGPAKRTRRTGKDLVAFRRMLNAERKKGAPVTDLAKRHGVSAAYIYQLR